MPFAADQFFWAARLQALGVAPAALSPKRLGAETLAKALAFAEAPGTRARAVTLGQAMAEECGVHEAITRLEHWLIPRQHKAGSDHKTLPWEH